MATHDTVLNSGCSSSPPSRTLPYRLNARYSEKARKPNDDSMNTQPKLGTRKLHSTASKTAARLSVKRRPHRMNTAEITAATKNTVESDRKSTRLNSSHANISYAVFCLKNKNGK